MLAHVRRMCVFSQTHATENEFTFLCLVVRCQRLTQNAHACAAATHAAPRGGFCPELASVASLPPREVKGPRELIFHQHVRNTEAVLWVSAGLKELHINLNQADYDPSEPNWQTLTAFMFY